MRIDFEFSENVPKTYTMSFADANGNDKDYSASTFRLRVWARDVAGQATGSALQTIETGSGIAGALADGEFQPTFAVGLAAGNYVHRCDRLVGGAAVAQQAWGWITVHPAIGSAAPLIGDGAGGVLGDGAGGVLGLLT